MPASLADKTIALLGGTGPQGRGPARRIAAGGLTVVIGSRNAERASGAAAELAAAGGRVSGAANIDAAATGDVALVAEEGSAAQQAQALFPDSVVVGAFHKVTDLMQGLARVTDV